MNSKDSSDHTLSQLQLPFQDTHYVEHPEIYQIIPTLDLVVCQGTLCVENTMISRLHLLKFQLSCKGTLCTGSLWAIQITPSSASAILARCTLHFETWDTLAGTHFSFKSTDCLESIRIILNYPHFSFGFPYRINIAQKALGPPAHASHRSSQSTTI